MATNFLKLTREQLSIITGEDPRAIKAFEDFIAAINALGTHAPTHEPGGSDPLTVDALPAVGSLRTLGTGAQKAAAGIHAATHVTGGGDPLAFAPVTGTAAALAALNPVLAVGQLGWETDTLSGKIGDGATAYNTLTYFYRGLPVAGEPSFGTWHKVSNPQTGSLASKVAGWTADRFTAATGGLEVDFTGTVPIDARFVQATISLATTAERVYVRAEGDTNISNTPEASNEASQAVASNLGRTRIVIPLSASQKAEFAVSGTGADLDVSYPAFYSE